MDWFVLNTLFLYPKILKHTFPTITPGSKQEIKIPLTGPADTPDSPWFP